MLFRKKDDYRSEMQDIKDIMEEPLEEIPTSQPHIASSAVRQDFSAPLFIKVDKYKEVLSTVQEIKLFISVLKQFFAVIHEAEAVKSNAISIMQATIQRVEKSITEIDTELLRPKGISISEMGGATPEIMQLENTLTDMQKQISNLRQHLQGAK